MWKGKTDEFGGEIPDCSVVSWLLALSAENLWVSRDWDSRINRIQSYIFSLNLKDPCLVVCGYQSSQLPVLHPNLVVPLRSLLGYQTEPDIQSLE